MKGGYGLREYLRPFPCLSSEPARVLRHGDEIRRMAREAERKRDLFYPGFRVPRVVKTSGKWRAAFRWVLPTLGLSFLFLFLGQFANLYGTILLVYAGSVFLIVVLILYLGYLNARISSLEMRPARIERDEVELSDEEKMMLREELKRQLEKIPSMRKIHPTGPEGVKLREWRRRTLALLESAYGGYNAEVEDFAELSFHRNAAGDLNEAQAIIKVAIEMRLAE